MAYVTGVNEKEKIVYYVETKGAWDTPDAEQRLVEAGCASIQLWAVGPTFDNEYFAKTYGEKATEIRPL